MQANGPSSSFSTVSDFRRPRHQASRSLACAWRECRSKRCPVSRNSSSSRARSRAARSADLETLGRGMDGRARTSTGGNLPACEKSGAIASISLARSRREIALRFLRPHIDGGASYKKTGILWLKCCDFAPLTPCGQHDGWQSAPDWVSRHSHGMARSVLPQSMRTVT